MNDFEKTINGAATFHDGNTINCKNANITVEGASTATFAGLDVKGKVTLTCNGKFLFGSTLVIDRLNCLDGEINTNTSSTIDIKNFNSTGSVKILVDRASTLRIRDGSLNIIDGTVKNASTGVCRASIKNDGVVAESASTWDAG